MSATAAPAIREGRTRRPDGRTVAWVVTGAFDGRPILRIPGTPGSRLQIRVDQAPWLARNLLMIVTERPGFGASTYHAGRSLEDHADDLVAVLDDLGIHSVPVFAGSGGAPYALALAAVHADRVDNVTIVVGAAPIDDDEAGGLIGVNAAGYRLAKAGDRDGMVALLEPIRRTMLDDPIAAFRGIMDTAPGPDQEIMHDAAWQTMLARGLTESLRPGVEGWADESMLMFDGWSNLDPSNVGASVTWWHGDDDRNSPITAVRRLIARLPNARLIEWHAAGHLASYRLEGEILDELLERSDGLR